MQDFDAKEMYLHLKNRSVVFKKRRKIFFFHHLQVFTEYYFQNVLVTVPFSKSTVFKICRQKMCRFRVNRRPIRRIFNRFQNVPASCKRGLRHRNKENVVEVFVWEQELYFLFWSMIYLLLIS